MENEDGNVGRNHGRGLGVWVVGNRGSKNETGNKDVRGECGEWEGRNDAIRRVRM